MGFNTSLLFLLITFSILTHETLAYLIWPDDACYYAHYHDKDICNGTQQRWYYDWVTNRCHPFLYGECEGSANRFLSESDCLYACLPHLLNLFLVIARLFK